MTTTALVLLAGCVAGPPQWQRNDDTPGDLYRDDGHCRVQALSGVPGFGLLSQLRSDEIYKACMRGKGWRAQV